MTRSRSVAASPDAMAAAPKTPTKAAAKSPPLIALQGAAVDLGNRRRFEGLYLALALGERACLVGRNGSGKSTILRLLSGLQDPDAGQRFLQPGTRVGYPPQD